MDNYRFKKGDVVISTVTKVIYTVNYTIPSIDSIGIKRESNIVGLINADGIKLYTEYHREEILKLLLDEI